MTLYRQHDKKNRGMLGNTNLARGFTAGNNK